MKNVKNYLVYASCIVAIAFSAASFAKVYASNAPSASPAAGQPVDLTYATDKALPSVVTVKVVQNSKTETVEVEDPFSDFFDPFGFFGQRGQGGTRKQRVQTPKKQGSGSGVIISTEGYIVTNNHVVEGADEITVILTDNREFSATVVGNDPNTDLALIKVSGKNLPAITIGDSQKLKIGEWVLAIGNPYNIGTTVTAGIVSAKARSMSGGNTVQSFIQTDAAINPGNSGGALVNTNGELVGINSMLYSQTGSYSGYGFAIPTTIMNKVVNDLKTYGTVQRALIGIAGSDLSSYTDGLKQQGKDVPDFGTINGIYVAEVSEDGAGASAGLKKGDVITAIDGKSLSKMAELQEYLANKRPGDKVTITYLRDKSKKSATVTLKNAQGNTNVVKTADLDVLGGNFREITKEQKDQLGINYGLEVIKVNNGALKNAGVPKGFIIQKVNDQPMKSLSELQDAVKNASTSKEPVLFIQGIFSTGKKAYYAVPLEEGK
ncbi:MAG: trypsin-like peptidase domain-containing protein [Prevotella sp.]|nr:trypsin-like peptidase domain-containing protein [Prevotella sp.]